MINVKYRRFIVIAATLLLAGAWSVGSVYAQAGRQVRWLRVGSLHSWYSNFGGEMELGRTGDAQEQQDGLRYPAQYRYQDCLVGKAVWIGTTNYEDSRVGQTFPYKVVGIGPRVADPHVQYMPAEFKLVGRFAAPAVEVDGLAASENVLNDLVDEWDSTLPCDRMIVNVNHSSIGVTATRKIMAFAQQNHDNYFITDYVFKNTGIIDMNGTVENKTLTGVYFHFIYRYGTGHEAFRGGWAPANEINWGRNTVNQAIGMDPTSPDYEFRAMYSWYGPHSAASYDDWGCPNPQNGVLAGTQYIGNVVLHADRGPGDPVDDLYQPSTMGYAGMDENPTQGIDQYNAQSMTNKYIDFIQAGRISPTHAEEVGDSHADDWGTDLGGYGQIQSFGPYTLAPGDSVHLVIAEGVAGIDRVTNLEVGRAWVDGTGPFIGPDGAQSASADAYKEAWVKTGEDSLLQTFRRAVANYDNGYVIPMPPPPPENFRVQSGGDRIQLFWADNAVSADNFDGYRLYRAVGKPDTTYELIHESSAANAVHQFDDVTASRGFDYYYYIQSKDDGSTNTVQPGVPLVSSQFWTMTNEPAYLRRPAEASFDELRVVPNPYHINAVDLQFGTTSPDRIAFYGLPKFCTIKIFTERGDLIKTIEHTDGSGDELWDSTTESRQIIVSGVYIIHVEVSEEITDDDTGEVLFRKGDATYRKFVVIR